MRSSLEALLSALGISLAATNGLAPTSAIEQYGAMGLLALVLWLVLNRQANAIDNLSQKIDLLIREKRFDDRG